jgi:P-type Ca2+ transporter type 2C
MHGLTSAEAAARLRRFGPNRIARETRAARLKQIVLFFVDPMALMLVAASATYFILNQRTEAVVLLAALVPILGVDVVLDARSRGALKKLAQSLSSRTTVIRDGVEGEIETDHVVPGDLMLLTEGGFIHANGWLRAGSNLAIDESQLTGEAGPQAKVPLQPEPGHENLEEFSRVYAGSRVIAGHGWAEVTATGAQTSYGHLAQLVSEAKARPTPLQQKTAKLAHWLAVTAVLLSGGLFLLWVARGEEPRHAFLFAISLAMSAVSEEFLIVLTMFLSLGAWRLSRHGVLVKRLASAETLGATTVICLDKTGTLTTGDFTLTTLIPFSNTLSESEILDNAVLACEPDPADSIDRAIVAYCVQLGTDLKAIYSQWQLLRDHPFDPLGKHMSHVWQSIAKGAHAYARIVAKGALEGVLEHCNLTPEERVHVQSANAELALQGARVLALAGRQIQCGAPSLAGAREQDESGLRLYALLGFQDPMRREVPAAIAMCQRAGVRLKLITGDHALTAHAIADASGLAHNESGIITGAHLETLTQDQFTDAVRRCSVFARVRPEQKYAIVDCLQRSGEIVAMTGDGVNDAPAMRRADIAVSMGRRATEVARSVADLVLLKDDFTAMAATIREGREIYSSIQKSFLYLVGFKLMLVVTALIVPSVNLPILLLPVNLVWLELIVHPVSALAFEGSGASFDTMLAPPRDPKASLIDLASASRAAICGALLAVSAIVFYRYRLPVGEDYARGCALGVAILGSLLLVWAEYAGALPWRKVKFPRNTRFWIVVVCVALSLPVFMFARPVASVLMISPISLTDGALALGAAVIAVGWRAFGSPPRCRTTKDLD